MTEDIDTPINWNMPRPNFYPSPTGALCGWSSSAASAAAATYRMYPFIWPALFHQHTSEMGHMTFARVGSHLAGLDLQHACHSGIFGENLTNNSQ